MKIYIQMERQHCIVVEDLGFPKGESANPGERGDNKLLSSLFLPKISLKWKKDLGGISILCTQLDPPLCRTKMY